ncbi:hypothetical protein SAMN04487788_1011 [Microbacterium testaceum StLB037]|uniref:Uncharacterized protein n=1 Tax=Microbacterium testaceum (strain StLB037) TaxID=979556 RepID=A0A1H0MK60_MICTS|nr:hypothetical protein [Microbacterium testaceum]SDO80751.1 hypothetical protein SAMN04487788_1011 [Microbacterium testaceum StLB037]
MDDDVELHRLRERVYGAEGATATPDMIERLAELEERARRSAVPVTAAAPAPVGALDPTRPSSPVGPRADPSTASDAYALSEPGTSEPDGEVDRTRATIPDATASPPRRLLRIIATVVGALVVLGIGIAIGASTAPTVAATPDPAAAALPELTFPQTVEDVISAEILRDSGIDAGSTRYIATVSDFRIYLAQPDDGDGRCIVTFTSTDNRPWSAGCASGAQEGAAIFGVDESLTVAIGDPDGSDVTGIPIRLSPSVTAYVAQ